MNSREVVLGRVLRLFPVRNIVEYFETEEKKQDKAIIEICSSNTTRQVYQYVKDNFELTKQNVNVYSISNRYASRQLISNNDLSAIILQQEYRNGNFTLTGYHKIVNTITFFDGNQVRTEDIKLRQPFKIFIEGNYLIISVTKLESNPKTYFDNPVSIISSTGGRFDSIIIQNILDYFDTNFRLRPRQADLNRGIKHLWSNDVIDAKELSFRKTASRAKEVMDEDSLFKDRYPREYADVMRSPLELCIFRYVRGDEEWPKHFTCDPQVGKISFTLYSEDINQVKNVVDGIIANN